MEISPNIGKINVLDKQFNEEKKMLKYNAITKEDNDIITSLDKVKEDLYCAQRNFDLVTDHALIDGFIFEIMSLNKKYEYYIKECKSRGLAFNFNA